MNDDLKRLQAALKAGPPRPDEDAKARAIALAQKNFAARQGLQSAARPKNNRPENRGGIVERMKSMFAQIGLRQALLTTSSLAAVGLGVVLVLPMNNLTPPTLFESGETEMTSADMAPIPETPILMEETPQYLAKPSPAKTKARRAEAPLGVLAMPTMADDTLMQAQDQEQFSNVASNPLKITKEEPVSTFSIDVDTASYAYIRANLESGTLPRPDAVRIEEMVNYFPYDYAAPKADVPFSTSVSVFQTPWNSDTKLIHIGIQGEKAAVDDRPPLDLVFLIDTSGSMQDANKLPLLKQSFRLLLSKLTAQDKVSIVTYAGSSSVVLEPTLASDRSTIMAALDRLEAGGSTAGQAGLQLAYQQAEKMHSEGRIGRVLLATDGDFNVGISNPEDLKTYIADKRDSGTYLSVLGFGRGNYSDALMQSLAQNGNGTAAYIDTLSEAQKVLVDQVSGALFPIANDVKIQIEFNPAKIAEYRLIGYETRALAREDFNNDKVDAGDIGAGHTITAIYEITLVGSPAIKSDPLRYQASTAVTPSTDELAFLKLRYKNPGANSSQLIQTQITDDNNASDEALFSAAIAGFGQLLREDKYLGNWSYPDAINLANTSKGEDAYGYRHEAINLMRLAETLSN